MSIATQPTAAAEILMEFGYDPAEFGIPATVPATRRFGIREGDVVVCINPLGTDKLEEGHLYVVREIVGDTGGIQVDSIECLCGWNEDRFRLAYRVEG